MVQLINLTEEQLQQIVAETIRKELENHSSPQDNRPAEKKYYTRKETAEQLRVSLPTLNEYTKKGAIKGKRIGSRVLYSEDAIQEALKAMYK